MTSSTAEIETALPRRLWPTFLAFAVLLALHLLASFPLLVAMLASSGTAGMSADLPTPVLLASYAAAQIATVIVIVPVLALSKEHWRARVLLPRLRAPRGDVTLVTIAVLALGSVSSGVAVILDLYGGSHLERLDRAVANAAGPSLLGFALLIPFAGVTEELFFRGVIQSRLMRRARPALAIAFTAAVFGAMHFDPLHSTFAVLFGVLIGWVAWRTGSIATGIYAHAINNAVAVASSVATGGALVFSKPQQAVVILVAIVIGSAAVVALHRRFARRSPHEYAPRAPSTGAAPVVAAIAVPGCGAVVLIVLGVSVAAGPLVSTFAGAPAEVLAAARADGRSAGEQSNERACLERAVRRAEECTAQHTLGCPSIGSAYLRACVERAARDPTFCEPVRDGSAGVRAWSQEVCAALKTERPIECGILAAVAAKHCRAD